MKVLLTGGDGFIGQWLARELRDHGHSVSVVDIRPQRPGTIFRDLVVPWGAEQAVEQAQPDVVVHLAAQVGRLKGEDSPEVTIRSNALMSANVARATARFGARLVYTSTSEVYGDQRHGVCEEDAGPWALPHNLYGLSKRWGEEVCALYAQPGTLQVVRPSMPYGPGVPPGRGRRAMDNMLWQAHHQMPIPVHKGSRRSWCWIGDVARGYRLIIERGEPSAYNLGRDDREVAMFDLAVAACDYADAPKSLIEVIQPPVRQTVVKRLSTDKLRSLDWKPEVELEEGMPQVYEWIKNFGPNGEWIGGAMRAEA